MTDLLARYKQVEADVRSPLDKFDLVLKDSRVVLQYGSGCTAIFTGCFDTALFLFLCVLSIMAYRNLAYPGYIFVFGVLAFLMFGLLWKQNIFRPSSFNRPLAEIDTKRQEIFIYPRSQPKISLSVDQIECFLGIFHLYTSGRYGSQNQRKLYVVSRDGRMHRLSERNPEEANAQRLLKALSYICDRPFYLIEEGMHTSPFISQQPDGQIFNVSKFLEVQKATIV